MTAADIRLAQNLEIVNPKQVICTLDKKKKFEMELEVKVGRGFCPGDENKKPNQPIGAVYLRRQGKNVVCFNAICPHAGCFVGYAADRKIFQCPCHTSSFQLDGRRISPSPSPRNMDELKVEADKLKLGEVWIEFVNYYPGTEDREEKPT